MYSTLALFGKAERDWIETYKVGSVCKSRQRVRVAVLVVDDSLVFEVRDGVSDGSERGGSKLPAAYRRRDARPQSGKDNRQAARSFSPNM